MSPSPTTVVTAPSLDGIESSDRVEAMVDWLIGKLENAARDKGAEGGYILIAAVRTMPDEVDAFFPEAEEKWIGRFIEVGVVPIWRLQKAD